VIRILVWRLLTDTSGQDVVEHALLAGFVGLAALGTVDIVLTAMGVSYTSWLSNAGGLWETPPPGP
jgi:Flp pilus assembly pilin Flp